MEAVPGGPGGRKGTLEWGTGDAFSPPLIPAPNLSVPQVWILEAKTNTLTSSKHQLFSSLQSYKNESLKNKQYAVERASIRFEGLRVPETGDKKDSEFQSSA